MRMIFFMVALLLAFTAESQRPVSWINEWTEKLPVEKVYIHTDRENYLAGESAWFKAYLYSDFYPDTISTTLITDMLNTNGQLVVRMVWPVVYGTAKGQIEIPDSLLTGNYVIRAYSPTMLNHDNDFLFTRTIAVVGKKGESITPTEKKIRVELFPEGGNLVEGFSNTIAFKVTDEDGLPLGLSGCLKNGNNDSITSFSSYHDGMGYFEFIPQKDSKYYVVIKDDPQQLKHYLFPANREGIVFRLIPAPNGYNYEIFQRWSDPAFKATSIIGLMQHRLVLKMKLDKTKNGMAGFIDTRQLRSGVMHLTVFAEDSLPLAERLIFIDNKEYLQPGQIFTDSVSAGKRERNKLTLYIPDSVAGNFSIAVTDEAYETESRKTSNIISSLLLSSDIRGHVHNPAWYFAAPADSAKNGLDLVMMVNGWRRFHWSEIQKLAAAMPVYKDPGYITVSGIVNIRDTKKPVAEKPLLLMMSSLQDSVNSGMQMINTDSLGNFRLDSMIFSGTARFLFSDISEKKKKRLDVNIDIDSIRTAYMISTVDKSRFTPRSFFSKSAAESKMAFDYESILKAEGQILKGITIKVKKKSPLQELEEKYTSGMFSGVSVKTIDLVNTNEKIYQNNIFDYIQGRVAGVSVRKSGLNYTLYYRQRFSLTGGSIPMVLFLNEMQVDGRLLATIPANQVAMIKVFSSFFGTEGNGTGGVLAVYTKQGIDFAGTGMESSDALLFKGYSVSKEFYSPDYSVKQNNTKADNRITLHWQPEMIVEGKDVKVPVVFYNNERSKSFKVIAEGITADGKFLFIEKVITPGQKAF